MADEVENELIAGTHNGRPPVVAEREFNPFAVLHTTIRALADKVMRWVVLLMSFSLFAYDAFRPNLLTFAGACAFTVLALTLLWRERKR